MVLSQVLWPLSFVYPSETKMNPVETNLVRTIVTLVSHYWIISYFNMNFSLKSPTNFRVMLLRNFITCIHQFVLTSAPFFLPFPIVFTLNSSSVLFVFILDYFIFKVEINKQQVIGVIFGFLGVLLTVNG
jgi:drug/metabolite transporter (DMT)-like permease